MTFQWLSAIVVDVGSVPRPSPIFHMGHLGCSILQWFLYFHPETWGRWSLFGWLARIVFPSMGGPPKQLSTIGRVWPLTVSFATSINVAPRDFPWFFLVGKGVDPNAKGLATEKSRYSERFGTFTCVYEYVFGWWFEVFFAFTQMIQFDKYFSNGMKPPTRCILIVCICVHCFLVILFNFLFIYICTYRILI